MNTGTAKELVDLWEGGRDHYTIISLQHRIQFLRRLEKTFQWYVGQKCTGNVGWWGEVQQNCHMYIHIPNWSLGSMSVDCPCVHHMDFIMSESALRLQAPFSLVSTSPTPQVGNSSQASTAV